MAIDLLFSVPVSRKRQASIRQKYIFFSACLFAVILVLGTLAFVILAKPVGLADIKAEATHIAERERLGLQAKVDGEIALVYKMASSPLIRRYLTDPSNRRHQALALEEIAGYRRVFATHNVFWISDRDKKYHWGDEYLYTMDPHTPGNEWYNQFLESPAPYQLNVNYDNGLQKAMVWIKALVFDDAYRPIGIVGTCENVNTFVQNVYQGYKGTSEFFVFNTSGEVIGVRNADAVANKMNIAEILGETGREVLQNAKNSLKMNGRVCFETSNGKAVVALDYAPELNWHVAIVHYYASGETLPAGLTALFAVAMTVIFLIFAVLTVYVVKILAPFNNVVKSIHDTLSIEEITTETKKHNTGEVQTLGDLLTMTLMDPLTSIYNRRYMEGQLKKVMKSLGRSGGVLSMLLIDIDHFKLFNDTYGHEAGDECLKMVAGAMMQCLNRDGDFLARFGGEEFCIVLPHTDKIGAQFVANKLLESVRRCNITHQSSDTTDRVTISIGGTTGTVRHTHSAKDFIRLADAALYESKKNGRNSYTHKAFD